MKIILLDHHVQPNPWSVYGVLDALADMGLPDTLGDIHRIVIPKLKLVLNDEGKPRYPFLTKDPKARRKFEHHILEAYQAYLAENFIQIPDYDPETGRRNKDHICEGCPTWDTSCQYKTLPNKERF